MSVLTGGAGDLPHRSKCVVPHILERRARETPDKVFVDFGNGETWTLAETRRRTLEVASGLRRLGVKAGGRVLCWAPDSAELLLAWFGINQLGAIYVPINIAYRGSILQHVVANAAAEVMIVHAGLLDRLSDIDLGGTRQIVVVGGAVPADSMVRFHDAGALFGQEIDPAVEESPAEPWDPYAIIYTSGTTGPSKGVVCSYLHVWATGAKSLGPYARPEDRILLTLPLFHAGGTLGVTAALSEGCSVALTGPFDTAAFWDVVRRTGSTMCTLLGVMATFLLKQSPRCDDADTPLRLINMIPLIEASDDFSRRFGCDVLTCFNMTEISCPLISDPNPSVTGACGRVRSGVEVRLVDEHDREVPIGTVGELIVRTDMPWTLNSGYWRNSEATAQAWRNGWFHTGDGFRRNENGDYFFVDRLKDAIRRRGENISSFEVEAEILAYPAIREAAAVGVRSNLSEDDVLAIVAPVPGETIDPVALVRFLANRMPHFMVPRYVRVLSALPKTQTNKVEKHVLRSEGVTPDTWDREAAGIRLRREKLSNALIDAS